MYNENWIESYLAEIRARGLSRHPVEYPAQGPRLNVNGRSVLNFSSNDYLALGRDSRVIAGSEAALKKYGAAASASRLVTGSLPLHGELEARLASFFGFEQALLFGSGYLANLGAITSLVGRDDVVILDKLAHASLVDGALLSRAELARFRHNDVGHLSELLVRVRKEKGEKSRILIVTESVFSMDGDLAALEEIVLAANKHDAMLLVDEAHALGVFGTSGRGRVHELGLSVNVVTGTLSKAFGSYGGFVLCSSGVRELLQNSARQFIYSTALPPALLGSALSSLSILESEPELGSALLAESETFRTELRIRGFDTLNSASQIVPIVIGENERTCAVSRALLEQGVLGIPIRTPTVPQGTERIRFSIIRGHERADFAFVGDALQAAYQQVSPQ